MTSAGVITTLKYTTSNTLLHILNWLVNIQTSNYSALVVMTRYTVGQQELLTIKGDNMKTLCNLIDKFDVNGMIAVAFFFAGFYATCSSTPGAGIPAIIGSIAYLCLRTK